MSNRRVFGNGALAFAPILTIACSSGGNFDETSPGGGEEIPAGEAHPSIGQPPSLQAVGRRLDLAVYTVPPLLDSTLTLEGIPDAACTLGAKGQPSDGRSVLVTDETGFVDVHVNMKEQPSGSARLVLTCQDEGGAVATRDIEIRVVAGTKPSTGLERAPKQAVLKPGLTSDVTKLSQAELVARGYAPHPDPQMQPEAYKTWLNVVSKPLTSITPKLISRPGVQHGLAWSSNWGGYVAKTSDPNARFHEAWATIMVPTARSPVGTGSASQTSSLWVGLDGYTCCGDVVQDGIDITTINIFSSTIGFYSAWYEVFPADSVTISNFAVAPGDAIFTVTWVGDAAGNLNWQGGFGWFWIVNSTRGNEAMIHTRVAKSFHGTSAEWIVERPTINGSLAPLAMFTTTTMENPFAWDPLHGSLLYLNEASIDRITLTRDGRQPPLSDPARGILAGAQPTSSSRLTFSTYASE